MLFYLAVLLVLRQPVVLGGGSGQGREAILWVRQEPMFFVVTFVPRTLCGLLGLLRRGRTEPAHEIDFGHIYVGSARTDFQMETGERTTLESQNVAARKYHLLNNR